jgi:hypothetical protein
MRLPLPYFAQSMRPGDIIEAPNMGDARDLPGERGRQRTRGGSWPVSRLIAIAAAVAVALAALPAVASAKNGVSKIVTYITTYTGHYDFVELRKDVDYAGRTTVSTQNQGYTWQEEDKDVIVPRGNGTVKETRYTTLDASGDYDGSIYGQPPTHCAYSSSPGKEFKSNVLGDPEGVRPVHGNPLIPYAWRLPEIVGTLGIKSSCGPQSGEVLEFTPLQTGTIGAPIEVTNDFSDAFVGSDAVRFKDMPARHPINGSIPLGTQQLANGGYDSAQVTLVGGVEFARWGDPRNNNKVGNLLLNDLLEALGAEASGDGSAMADGENDTILVPGMVPGTVTTEVTGTVTWTNGSGARDAAAQPTTLYTGKATINGDNAVTMTVKPTAAGRAALAAAHPSIPITLRATFNPSGNGKKTTKSLIGTLGSGLS